jgi:uncharacterized protein YkwD
MRIVVALAVTACTVPVAPVAPRSSEVAAIDVARWVAPRGVHRQTTLDTVAEVAAASASEGYVVSASALGDAMARELDSAESPYVLTGWGTDAEVTAQLERALDELRGAVEIADVGIATASGPAGRVGVVIAMPAPTLPVTVEDGRITLPWAWSEPPRAYAIAAERSRRLDPAVVDATFTLALDCTHPASIQIFAGTRVVASVVDPCRANVGPTTSRPGAVEAGPVARSPTEIEMRIFELVNRERARHGLAALQFDPKALLVARAHAAEMAAHGYIGHDTAEGIGFPQRMVVLDARSARENVGHAWGPAEVHLAFMHSAGHRSNILAADITRGAIGVSVDEHDPTGFYVTELFRSD